MNLISAFCVLLGVASTAWSQPLAPLVSDQPVNQGDVVQVIVREELEESDVVLAQEDVEIKNEAVSLPILGRVDIRKESPLSLQVAILERLRKQSPGSAFSVGIRMKRPRAADVVKLGGAVNFEGAVPWRDNMTLEEAIAEAGGLRYKANAKSVVLIRKGALYKLNLRDLKGRSFQLRVDDNISIPE